MSADTVSLTGTQLLEFSNALDFLGQEKQIPWDIAYPASRCRSRVKNLVESIREGLTRAQEDFASLDETGKPKTDARGGLVFDTKSGRDGYKAAEKRLLKEEQFEFEPYRAKRSVLDDLLAKMKAVKDDEKRVPSWWLDSTEAVLFEAE